MHRHFSDHALEFDRRDTVIFRRRREPLVEGAPIGRMELEAHHDARQVAPAWDLPMLEAE